MISSWNNRSRHGDGDGPEDAGSLAPGANVGRRRFVELAVGAVAGVSLVGLPAPQAASETVGERAVDDPCRGEGRGGAAAEVLEYQDLVGLHRAATG
jgi:hypothetical protein